MSRTVQCRTCGTQVDADAERCPQCGRTHPTARPSHPPPPLVTPAQVHRRRVRCRVCGESVPVGTATCLACGAPHPDKSAARRLKPVLLPLAAIAAIAAGWRVGVLVDRRWGGERSSLESGLSSVAPAITEPPRIRSDRFEASCAVAAPVLVYSADSTPSTFLVQIAGSTTDANRVADSLTRQYALESRGYDDARQRLAIDGATPATVSRLRCDPSVSALEERISR